MMKHPVHISGCWLQSSKTRTYSSILCNHVLYGIRPNLIGSCWAKMFLLLAPVMNSSWSLLSWTRNACSLLYQLTNYKKKCRYLFGFLERMMWYIEKFQKIIIRLINLRNALLSQGQLVNDASLIYLSFFSRKKAKIFAKNQMIKMDVH